jgi:hypothetical protein
MSKIQEQDRDEEDWLIQYDSKHRQGRVALNRGHTQMQ